MNKDKSIGSRMRLQGWGAPWIPAAALVLLTVLAYLPALRGGFIWDDDAYVTQNPTLLSAAGLWQIWSDPAATPQYYPLVHTSFWIEQHLWGLRPVGYHCTNVLLHALAAVLRRLALPCAWLAAAVFALHPVQVESVAWITERKNVLSGFFYLGALLAYLRFAGIGESGGGASKVWRYYALALLLFVCALLSKTVVCTLTAVLVLLLWWKQDRVRWADLRPLIPMFMLGLALGLTTVWLEKHHVGAAGVDWQLLWVERCLVAGRALWFYAAKLVWPQELVFIYPRWAVDGAAAWQYLFPAAALAVVAGLWRLRRRIGRGPLVAVLCFAGTLLPALGFFDVYPMRYSYVADHFQYLASISIIVLVTAGVVQAAERWRRPRLPQAFAAVVLPLLGLLTWWQCGQYRDLETLWRTTIEKNPQCWLAHNNLGLVLFQRGQVDEALMHYQRALAVHHDFAEAHNSVGNVAFQKGQLEAAATHYRRALDLQPDYAEASSNLGNALFQQGRLNEAITQYQSALKMQPGLLIAHNNLGLAFAQTGQMDQAIAEFHQVLALQPGLASGHGNLALVLLQSGKAGEAITHYQHALELDPDEMNSLITLAWVLATCPEASVRNGARALKLALHAQELSKADHPMVLHALAAAYAETGRFSEALEAVQQAINAANAQGNAALAAAIREERRTYQDGKPFRDSRIQGTQSD